MAFTNTKNLHSDPHINLRDQQHAAKLFNDQQFRLAPKFDFSFAVSFGINTAALKNASLYTQHGNEINMLVKGIDLPTYTVTVDTVNQYNRKKNIQYYHVPGEFTVKFHDDNIGLINQLWQNYYSYHYADPTSAQSPGAYNRNATQSSDYITSSYGLDNGSTASFFTYIKIYQFARHEYIGYTLVNPIITSFSHNKLDYGSNKIRELDMKIKCEAVAYSSGVVGDGTGFEVSPEHYDLTPSPLSGLNPDPSVNNNSMLKTQNINAAAPEILNNTVTTVNTYQNTQQPINSSGTAGITTVSTIQSIGGLAGVAFPQAASAVKSITSALPINLGI